MNSMLGGLAAAAAGRWKRSLAIVLAVIVAIGVAARVGGGTFSDDVSVPNSDSQAATDLLEERFPAQAGDTATVVFSVEKGTLRETDRRAAIDRTAQEIARQPHVTSAASPFSSEAKKQLSSDGRTAYVTVQYDEPGRELGREPGERLEDAAHIAERAGIDVARRGTVVDQAEERQLPVGELVGLAVALLVLTIVLRSVAGMAVTLLSAALALAAGLLLLNAATAFTDFPTVAPTVALMLGLGAGIDYALLVVARHREQLAAGASVPAAARASGATAGASALTAGAIVVVAIAGLLATGIPMVGRMGIGSAIVVAAVALGAVTVLPVLLGAAGRRLRPREVRRTGAPARWDERITERPWRAMAVGVAILLLLAVPLTSLRLGQPDDGNDPESSTTRQAYDRLAEGFGPGINGPLTLAAEVPAGADAQTVLQPVRSELEQVPGVASVSPPRVNERGDAAVLTVVPDSAPQDARTADLVQRLRADVMPAATRGTGLEVHVGGLTATFDDLADQIADSLPAFIALVVGLSVLLLMAAFRSVWVPIVSALLNLLSIGAAYGVVVAVFQWGWGSSLLGVSGDVPIVSFIPLFMFAVLFGLSMDYNVFLQSRIREEHLAGLDARRSVLVGLARTTRIILGAGAIMIAVFLGFVSNPDVMVKMLGVGLATAILIDVLLVRLVVAPAVMTLLGDRAWWMPGWLGRVLPRVALDREAVEHR
jgi:RND superfamily putative drug exporter